jgi:hypothetical protein
MTMRFFWLGERRNKSTCRNKRSFQFLRPRRFYGWWIRTHAFNYFYYDFRKFLKMHESFWNYFFWNYRYLWKLLKLFDSFSNYFFWNYFFLKLL